MKSENLEEDPTTSSEHPIAIIQLSTPSTVYLFHLASYNHPENPPESSSDESEDDAQHSMESPPRARNLPQNPMEIDEEYLKSQIDENGNLIRKYSISSELRDILESKSFIKVGIDILKQFEKLEKDYDVQVDPFSLIDIGNLYEKKEMIFDGWMENNEGERGRDDDDGDEVMMEVPQFSLFGGFLHPHHFAKLFF